MKGEKGKMKFVSYLIIILSLICSVEVLLANPGKNPKWPPKNYLVYYGEWDSEKISKAQDFDLVILHPGEKLDNITKESIKNLGHSKDHLEGTDGDVIIIAYISIGEDEDVPRGPGNPKDRLSGPVFRDKNKGTVEAKNDYPTRYLDEISYVFNEKGFFNWLPNGLPVMVHGHDGLPDENGKWQSYYVNPGDPLWQNLLINRMKILDTQYGVDGFFLDTLDTASPWGNYSWTQKDMVLLISKIRKEFPHKYLIANRGFFLLEKYADLFRSSIDGLMFESFISEWDWYRNIGIESPYLEDNYKILKEYILPNSRKEDGFHLFVLNYLNLEQKDFYNILYDQMEILKDIPYSSCISTPDLQQIYPPPASYISEEAYIIPKIKNLKVRETNKGNFTINFLLEGIETTDLIPGENLFLDIRYSEKDISIKKVQLLKRVYVDYNSFIKDNISVSSSGLDKDTTYYFFVKLLTKNPSIQTPYEKSTLHTEDGLYPGLIYSLQGEGRESSVYLIWEDEYVKSYNIYMGQDPESMTKYSTSTENNITIEGLTNNKAYYFSVSATSDKGEEGCLSAPIIVYPQDCTPPPSPENIRIEYRKERKELYITWDVIYCQDLAGYMLYCFPREKGLRLPIILGSDVYETILEGLIEGYDYQLFITSIDYNNNQSQPAEVKEILIPLE